MRFLNVIVAVDKNMGIGCDGKIPWCVYADMQHFKSVTQNSILIMGRKTWESVPDEHKGFTGRKAVIIISKNYVLSNDSKNIFVCKNLSAGIEKAVNVVSESRDKIKAGEQVKRKESYPSIFICGGTSLYREVLIHFTHLIKSLYITLIPGSFLCDTFFPIKEEELAKTFINVTQLLERYSVKSYPQLFTFNMNSEFDFGYRSRISRKNLITGVIKETPNYFLKFKKPSPDQNYVDLISTILIEGELKKDRTGVGTLSIFSYNLVFDLQDGFPLITRRKIFWKGCFEETLFFLKGKTNTKELEAKGVNIWKGNTSRKFLDQRGLSHLEEGDMGAGYGFLWRHFGSDYNDKSQKYKGVDQIERVIQQLKTEPHSRRHIISAWDPAHLDQCALPPCHILYQFYVRNDLFLDCKMTQRSCDVMLGLPFNMASYALITHIIAKKVGLKVGKLHISLGDAHIYTNHIDEAHQVIERPSMRWPVLKVGDKVYEKSIDELDISDFSLQEYGSFPSIKMEMAI